MGSDFTLEFDRVGAPLLEWLPGESFFSLCSRHHRLWGNGLSSRTTEILFGKPRLGCQHDLPGGLGAFTDRTGGVFGSAEGLAVERTLLRFYRSFTHEDQVSDAAASMSSDSVAHLKFKLGLLTSRFRANHPLKACRGCMNEDIGRFGWVYWHLHHQYPGVWMCAQHSAPLMVSTIKSTGVLRFHWCLPSLSELSDPLNDKSEAALLAHSKLSSLIDRLVATPHSPGWLSVESIGVPIKARLMDRGLLSAGGSLKLKDAVPLFLSHCSHLRGIAELSSLPTTTDAATVQLGRILRPLRTGTHPLRLLVVIDWLFGGYEDFVAELDRSSGTQAAAVLDAVDANRLSRSVNPLTETVIRLMKAGESATQAARQVGVDVSTAMAWGAAHGLSVGRRPKAVRGIVRESLLRALESGEDKADVAHKHGIAVGTVTRLLHTEAGLHVAWKAARFSAAQSQARTAWTTLRTANPAMGVKLLRASDPASYAWLRRNDRAWLDQNLPARINSTGPRGSAVNWDSRDQTLATEVQRAALGLSELAEGKGIKLWEIYQQVPELKARLGALDRLPLTKAALEIAVTSRQRRRRSDLL